MNDAGSMEVPWRFHGGLMHIPINVSKIPLSLLGSVA